MAPTASAEERHHFEMEEDNRKMRMAFYQIRTTGEKLEEKRKEEVNENCENARKE